MFKRLLLMAAVLLIAGAPNAFAAVGIFEFNQDVGNPKAFGSVQYIPQNMAGTGDRYLIQGGGNDIWGNADNFHFAYNEVSGDILLSAAVTWQANGDNDWSKAEVMLRDTTDTSSTHFSTATRGGPGDNAPGALGQGAYLQQRPVAGGGSNGENYYDLISQRIGVQRVTSNGYSIVQSLVDQGSGWELVGSGTRAAPFGDRDILAGIAVTSHDNDYAVQAWYDDVTYDPNPTLIGIRDIGDPLAETCGQMPGFLVKAVHMPDGWTFWGTRDENYEQAEHLVKNDGMVDFAGGPYPGAVGTEIGSKVVELVNFSDDGGVWDFTGPDFPDYSFPGIDDWVDPADDPDGDDQFAVLVEACIELTEGLHIIGGSFDDGLLIRIGGVEIGRNTSWDQRSAFIFNAPVAGIYSFEAIGYEIGGGAFLEIIEQLPDGTKVLLGDVANGASPVYCVPEPATIALLGFGGLSMLRIRKKR